MTFKLSVQWQTGTDLSNLVKISWNNCGSTFVYIRYQALTVRANRGETAACRKISTGSWCAGEKGRGKKFALNCV